MDGGSHKFQIGMRVLAILRMLVLVSNVMSKTFVPSDGDSRVGTLHSAHSTSHVGMQRDAKTKPEPGIVPLLPHPVKVVPLGNHAAKVAVPGEILGVVICSITCQLT